MNPLISIIIPVYKVEDYLEECVNSVLNQTYRNLEVILVDDGSPDNCPALCDNYARQDKRIKVIHKPNGGLSDARNEGLKNASGEYVLFLDSDDFYIDNEAISQLVKEVHKNPATDIVFYRRTTISGDNRLPSVSVIPDKIMGQDKISGLHYLLQNGDFMASACQKMMRRTLLTENSLFFEKGLLSEDWMWTIGVYAHAKVLSAIDSPFYGYRKRPGSITNTISDKHFDDIFYIITTWDKRLDKYGLSQAETNIYRGFLAYLYVSLLGLLYLASKAKRKEMIAKLRPYSRLLEYDISFKTRKAARLYRILGFNMMCIALRIYLKHHNSKRK